MIRRSRVWLPVAVVFLVVNLVGAGFAAAMGEPLHAAIHAVLLLPAAYLVRRFAPGRHARGVWRRREAEIPAESPEFTDRLSRLEQAVDTAAIEVGRMGDGQRFMTRFFTENATSKADADDRSVRDSGRPP